MTALEETIGAIEDDLDRARARVGQLENALEALRALTSPPTPRDASCYSAEALDLLHPNKRVVDHMGDTWQKFERGWGVLTRDMEDARAGRLTSKALIDFWGPIR